MDSSILLVAFWVIVVSLIAIKKKKGASKQSSRSSAAGQAAPMRSSQAVPVRMPRRSAAADNCDFGDANHYYSHQYDRRIQQLEGYLKAGLIDQKEYREMLARYRKQMRDME